MILKSETLQAAVATVDVGATAVVAVRLGVEVALCGGPGDSPPQPAVAANRQIPASAAVRHTIKVKYDDLAQSMGT